MFILFHVRQDMEIINLIIKSNYYFTINIEYGPSRNTLILGIHLYIYATYRSIKLKY